VWFSEAAVDGRKIYLDLKPPLTGVNLGENIPTLTGVPNFGPAG
jgi:hypothetical protein